MLKLRNIHKNFAHSESPALDNINLTLNNGEFCVLLGNNGSGKSTLMQIIAGFIPASKGQVIFDNIDLSHKSAIYRSKYIGSACQNSTKGCADELSIFENMTLSMMRNKTRHLKSYADYRESIKRQIAALGIGLEERLDLPMSLLSGGQKQMIITLMAMHNSPNILLLDEHTSALDPKMQKKVMQYTDQEIRARNLSTIMITHDLEDALQYGDRLVMLSKGKIILDISGEQKSNLPKAKLMELFHHHEEEII